MNRYGQMALDHNRKHRPAAYSQIPDPAGFFAEAGETPEQYRRRSYQVLATAEELTLADHPLLQPDRSQEIEDWSDDPDLGRRYQVLAEINEAINTPL